MASELVEKVRAAVAEVSCSFYSMPADVAEEHLHIAMSHAAIKAIAEWLDDNADEQYVSSADLLRKTLKEPPHE